MPHRPSCCLTALLIASCGQQNDRSGQEPELPPPLVRAVKAELRQVQRQIRTTGFLESEHQDTIRSQVAGRLLQLHVDEGSRVSAGAVLAELDDREAQSARKQLVVLRDSKSVDKQLAELEIDAAGRRTAQAGIEAQRTKAEFDRQSQLDPSIVSPKALEDAELAWQAAQEAAKVAAFNESKAKLEVGRIENAIAELQARIDELDVRLEYFKVRAPFSGIVTQRHVSPGSTIGLSSDLFDMIDPDHLLAYLDRPQAELDLVRQSRNVTFTTDAIPGREFTADIDLVSPIIDRATGHFRVRVRIRQPDAQTLVHGMFVRARIRAEAVRETLMVPKAAVLSEGDVAVVMAARAGKAMRVDLDPGLEQDQWVECKNRGKNGLEPGDLVIVEGHEDLEDQTAVRVSQ